MAEPSELRAVCAAVLPFVAARRKPDGGYGATPRLPATVEDTYHALRILALCHRFGVAGAMPSPAADPALTGFLQRCLAAAHRYSPRTLFHLFWCCGRAGVAADRAAATARGILHRDTDLESWYYAGRILLEVAGRPLPAGLAPRADQVLAQGYRRIDQAWMHLEVARHWQRATIPPAPALATWFQDCQNPDGGFGFFPGTTSFVENCHGGLAGLARLRVPPRHPRRAHGFLLACQTASGGFGRSHHTAPFLDATHHGLAALAFLPALTANPS